MTHNRSVPRMFVQCAIYLLLRFCKSKDYHWIYSSTILQIKTFKYLYSEFPGVDTFLQGFSVSKLGPTYVMSLKKVLFADYFTEQTSFFLSPESLLREQTENRNPESITIYWTQ